VVASTETGSSTSPPDLFTGGEIRHNINSLLTESMDTNQRFIAFKQLTANKTCNFVENMRLRPFCHQVLTFSKGIKEKGKKKS